MPTYDPVVWLFFGVLAAIDVAIVAVILTGAARFCVDVWKGRI